MICWMWHRRGRLQNTGATTSVLGLYDSTDPRIQRAHIELWKQAGLTFAAGSWWGKGGDQWYQHIDAAFAGYLERCEGLGFKICIYWEDVPGNNLDRTLRAIAQYAASPAYYKRHGLPVLFVYSRVYEKVGLDVLTALSDRYYLVLERPPVRKLPPELPLGCHWFGVPWTSPEHLLRQYNVVRDNPNWELFPLIYHGFDNTAARDPGTRWPAGGSSVEWFQKQLRLALSADPEHLMFPWNEMAEHSAFEPTVEFGRTYYDAMAKAVAEFINRP
ncbi:MAG: hypothetical protein D6725_01360 [Planctomycetota bacterium]|nr:MAG: hypothetical protein D6725_01360 [Planctomycetota bacterium]